jgi:ABC-type uncharacterized transport system auxiliary subunit
MSHCTAQLHVSLWKSADQFTAQRIFRIEMPAQTPNASGAATCLASAVNMNVDEIVQWLSGEMSGTLGRDRNSVFALPP